MNICNRCRRASSCDFMRADKTKCVNLEITYEALRAENERLKKRPTKEVVKAAYIEAYKHGYLGYVSDENAERNWNRSKAKQALKGE